MMHSLRIWSYSYNLALNASYIFSKMTVVTQPCSYFSFAFIWNKLLAEVRKSGKISKNRSTKTKWEFLGWNVIITCCNFFRFVSLQADLQARSLKVLVVSFGSFEGAQLWLEQTGCTFNVVLDQQRKVRMCETHLTFVISGLVFLPFSNLSNNKISEIEDGAFEGASSVVELHLTANHLESVRGSMFRGMEGLRMLWVYFKLLSQTHETGSNNVQIYCHIFTDWLRPQWTVWDPMGPFFRKILCSSQRRDTNYFSIPFKILPSF